MEQGLLILGIFLLLIFYIPVKTGGVWNIGNQTGIILGVLLYLSGMFYRPVTAAIEYMWQSKEGKALLLVTGGCLLFVLGIAVIETIFIIAAMLRRPKKPGTLVVLGCKLYEDRPSRTLAGRLQVAEKYMKAHPDTICIVSGGQGEDEPVSEAYSMYRYLTEQGIAAERIYREDESRSTRENLQLSMKIIRENLLNPHVIIVTSGFHQYRASLLARKMHLSYSSLSAATPWWLVPTFYVRELYGILYEGIRSILL